MPRGRGRHNKNAAAGDARLALGHEIGAKLARMDKGDRALVLEVAAATVAAIGDMPVAAKQVRRPRAVKPAGLRKPVVPKAPPEIDGEEEE